MTDIWVLTDDGSEIGPVGFTRADPRHRRTVRCGGNIPGAGGARWDTGLAVGGRAAVKPSPGEHTGDNETCPRRRLAHTVDKPFCRRAPRSPGREVRGAGPGDTR